jgi:hypothetical protein
MMMCAPIGGPFQSIQLNLGSQLAIGDLKAKIN